MKKDLTQGEVTRTMLLFAGPMILGNLLQQCYNIADTLIVGRYLGPDALAAVGSAYTLMTFLTSILIGLCMGSGSVYSFHFGRRDEAQMKNSMAIAFLLIGAVTIGMNAAVFAGLDWILKVLQVPGSLLGMMREYVAVIFAGIFFVFLYNYFSFLLRAVGNSVTPLWFLGGAAVLNVILDLVFVIRLHLGIGGAALATVIAQAFSGLGIGIYTWRKEPGLRPVRSEIRFGRAEVKEIVRFSTAACIQQSVMNFGILMIQGLVNSFGAAVMAAFAAGVKIDSFAYMPAQEFGNAFSIFTSQNHGAGKEERVRQGVRRAVTVSVWFCLAVSVLVWLLAPYLLQIFIDGSETEIIRIGAGYLRTEGAFYCGIGILFLLYAYFRGIGRPEMSVVLTVISLGTRVLLAYVLSPVPAIGVRGIWWAIPIGWILADIVGITAIIRRAPALSGPSRTE
ncbi:MAG: MATE family efflux transporter [Lachnospiraceae bacterium]|nr:MATE family efflux transporter [Lachnospiraceae bacterium]